MREVPVTDRQKTEKGLYGSYAPRVGGREVTAQLKDGSQTRRKGGTAMNSKIAFVSAMLAIAATSAPSPPAHAAPKRSPQEQCEAEGYLWSAALGCGNQWCPLDHAGGAAAPGSTGQDCHVAGSPTPHQCICNGFTGEWNIWIAGAPPPSRRVPPTGLNTIPTIGPSVSTPPRPPPTRSR